MGKVISLACIGIAAMVSGCGRGTTASQVDAGTAAYHAVLLSNGSVYFGKMEGIGTAYPILRDVYYVQSNVDQVTKAVTNILVKRGKEWHGPDRMILNERSIVFIEPVGADSKVAQLIADSKK